MVQKLLALVSGDCLPDNPDSPMNHEILLPGHLYQILLKVIIILFFLFFFHLYKNPISYLYFFKNKGKIR